MAEKSFSERCKYEATANAIFLFRAAYFIQVGMPASDDGEYGHDGEGILLGDTVDGFWAPRIESEYLTNQEMLNMETQDGGPAVCKLYETTKVFLSREEAEDWGKRHSFRFPDGWQVYAVPAMGELVQVLKGT